MKHFAQFIEQIQILYALVMLQKSLRLLIRAIWLGLAGVWTGWALHALGGWLPNPITWFVLGLGFAIVPLAQIFIALYSILTDLSPPASWIEMLDRRLHQRQQLSTAWEVAHKGGKAGLVAELLVQDVLALFPHAREPILKGGWYRKADLAAAGLLAVFSCGLLAALLVQPAPTQAGPLPTQAIPNTAPQPFTGQDPAADPQQPNGPGDQNGGLQQDQNGTNGQGNNEQNQAQGEAEPNQDSGAVADALRQLGSDLSRQAGTHELGQSLQDLEMDSAADALDDLSSQIEELSPETRENLAEALEDAASNLDQANAPELSQDMQAAADALQDEGTSPEQPMDQLADNLRQLESQMQAFQDGSSGGTNAGSQGDGGASGQAEPADRLLDENGQMEIPQENINSSGLLSPANPDAEGEGTASGSLDAILPQQSPAGQSPLLPSSFLWKWRNVVSQYFQR